MAREQVRQPLTLPTDVPEGTRAEFAYSDGTWRLVRFTIPLPAEE